MSAAIWAESPRETNPHERLGGGVTVDAASLASRAGSAPAPGGFMDMRVYNVTPDGQEYDLPYQPDPRTGRCPVQGCDCQDGPR